jgi:hypothetical protein
MGMSGTFSADGNTTSFIVSGVNDGRLTVILGDGTSTSFGGGTVTLQWSDDGGATYKTWPGSSQTATTTYTVDLPSGEVMRMRLNMTGSTTPSLYWRIVGNVVQG